MPAARRKPEPQLFHPKKKPQVVQSPPKASTPRPAPRPEPEDDDVKLPEGPYQEYKIMSSPSTGWKYNVMKFNSREPVDVMTWQEPVKLNRKDPRRQETSGSGSQEAVRPMLGLDGKPVIGADGRIVMVDAEGRPIHPAEGSSNGKDGKDKGATNNGKKKFQKKTRQVFIVPEAIRQLRREEKYPWVIEDGPGSEVWVGQMEEVSKAETHGFFMPTSESKFQFVSAHRWYKFQKKQNHTQLTAEEVDKLMEQQKKNRDPEFWLLRRRNGQPPSAATSAIFKAEAEGRILIGGSGSLVQHAGQSLGPGGRRLKAGDNKSTNDMDDEDGRPRRRKREDDGEGDMDEMLFEEEFADDDEMEPVDNDDEEAKELEERLKKEYKSANKQREGYMDESDEDEEDELTKDGKAMKKLIRNLEKNNAYDSDEERNPYASSEDEEEEEEPPAPVTEPAVQPQPSQAPSRSGSHPPPLKTPSQSKLPSTTGSRATSPAAPALGGHSVVAKRATSPKAPKAKTNGVGHVNSPLSGGPSSRATSPATGSRAGSPAATSPATPIQKPTKKRKATDEPGPNAQSPGANSAKKRKSMAAADAPPVEAKTVIDWLRNTPGATTKDCIKQFTKYLKDKPKRDQFTTMMRQLAVVKDGVLMLRNP
jgi:transcription initiation factor TFIIF subunit alpha